MSFIFRVLILLIFVSCKTGKKDLQKQNSNISQTFCIIKPSVISSGDSAELMAKVNESFKIEKSKKIVFSKNAIEFLYQGAKNKPFFKTDLLPALENKPIIIMLISGNDAIQGMRKLIGPTDPAKAEKGTIRNLYGKNITDNGIHCSDSYESFIREVSFFFPEKIQDLVEIKSDNE